MPGPLWVRANGFEVVVCLAGGGLQPDGRVKSVVPVVMPGAAPSGIRRSKFQKKTFDPSALHAKKAREEARLPAEMPGSGETEIWRIENIKDLAYRNVLVGITILSLGKATFMGHMQTSKAGLRGKSFSDEKMHQNLRWQNVRWGNVKTMSVKE